LVAPSRLAATMASRSWRAGLGCCCTIMQQQQTPAGRIARNFTSLHSLTLQVTPAPALVRAGTRAVHRRRSMNFVQCQLLRLARKPSLPRITHLLPNCICCGAVGANQHRAGGRRAGEPRRISRLQPRPVCQGSRRIRRAAGAPDAGNSLRAGPRLSRRAREAQGVHADRPACGPGR
jgi:hypothetical protein